MAVENYKFVSPTIETREVSQGKTRRPVEEVGPVIIGRFTKGPWKATIQDEKELLQVFGQPESGVGSKTNDFWRERYAQAPTYGSYAAYAYLQNAGPVTIINLKGLEHPRKTTGGEAGYPKSSDDLTPNATASQNAGAYGLFLIDSASSYTANSPKGVLAAVFYLQSGSSIRLTGEDVDGNNVTSETSGSAHWIKSSGVNKQFTTVIKQQGVSHGKSAITASFDFSENSSKFIRKVLNTNPVLTNGELVDTSKAYAYSRYYLGETFEDFANRKLTSGSVAGDVYGCVLALHNATVNYADYRQGAKKGRTGWIVGQNLETTGSFDPKQLTKLFRFWDLSEGEWSSRNVKVSISNIRFSRNDITGYGLFDVEFRNIDDHDTNPKFIESFVNCSLDKNSPNYIGKKIGTKYSEWDYDLKEWTEYGFYENKSKHFRVEIESGIDSGLTDPRLLPFGFYNPPTNPTFQVMAGASLTDLNISGSELLAKGGVNDIPHAPYDGVYMSLNTTASYDFPQPQFILSSSDVNVSDPRDVYFGADYTINNSQRRYTGFVDYTKYLPVGLSDNETYQEVFTLDNVRQSSGSVGGWKLDAFYESGSHLAGDSMTARGVESPLATSTVGYKAVLNAGFNSFTAPIYGGFDGFDITEKEPFHHRAGGGSIESGKTEFNSAMYNSIRVAIDSIRDPEKVDLNLASIPGVKNTSLTDSLIDVAESEGRTDFLSVIDLEGDYTPNTEDSTAETARMPNVDTTISNLETRKINSTYAASYYPWAVAEDPFSSNQVALPPSVAGVGVMAYTQRVGELWFAPAGYNRGGLSRRNAGLNFVDVIKPPKKRDRDRLQEMGVNPIAKMGKDIVIYGQKTMTQEQVDTNRINVRRMMIFLKKTLANISKEILFEGNVQATWDKFLSKARPVLDRLKATIGIEDYKLILDETTTTEALKDQNILYAIIAVKPVKSIEFIGMDFAFIDDRATFND